MNPAAVLEVEAEKEVLAASAQSRPESMVWRVNSRLNEGLLGGTSRKVWTLERRLP